MILFEPWEIVWSYLYTSISPVYCSYIWLLSGIPSPDLSAKSREAR